MSKYEYRILENSYGNKIVTEVALNKLGDQGFQIVAFQPETADEYARVILMREVPQPVDHTMYQPVKTANGVAYTPIAAQQVSIEEASSTFED